MNETVPQREAAQLDGVPLPEEQTMLVGHVAVLDTLTAQFIERRLPSAIMLHGPQGVGKATLAFHMARAILGATSDEAQERIDEQVAAGVHPNVFVLRMQPQDTGKGFYSAIRVEDVRELRQKLRQTRGRAGYRVCIIDSVDDCNKNSANALLKTLEEPPADTVFFLISHRPGQLLPTIRSRCQAHALRPLGDDEMARAMRAIAPEVGGQDLATVVTLSGGRPRRGCEALTMGGGETLGALQAWLKDPAGPSAAAHLALADALAAAGAVVEARFARDLLMEWLAEEAKQAAASGGEAGRYRLASAGELWDKAQVLFAEAETYNLDARQTLVAVFDAIRQHVLNHRSAFAE